MTMFLRAPAPAGRRTLADDRVLTLLIIGIVLAGAALRLQGLDRTSIWNDEAASWSIARQPFWDMMRATAGDNHPPLYNIILYATIQSLGNSEIALRLPSAIMGIANIYLLYRLGTVLWCRLTGVFSAAFLAFAGFHIWYSQEARMYALLCLTATAFALTTVLFLNGPSRLRAVLCGLAGIALLYSHIYGALEWASINFAVGLALVTGWTSTGWTSTGGTTRADKRVWLITQGIAVLAFLPWAFVLTHRARVVMNDFWIPFPTIRFLYWLVRGLAGGTPMLFALLLLVLIALLSSAGEDAPVANTPASNAGVPPGPQSLLPARHGPRFGLDLEWQKLFLLAWGVLPLLGGYALSIIGRPILQDRYLIGSLPPLLLLAARGLWMLRSNRLVLGGAIGALVACSAPAVYGSAASYLREDGRGAVAAFAERFRPSDAVVFSSPGIANTFAYYFHQPVAHEVIIHHPESDQIDWPGVTRVWVPVRDGIETQTSPVLARIEALYQRQQAFRFHGFTLYLYTRPEAPGAAVPQADSGHTQME